MISNAVRDYQKLRILEEMEVISTTLFQMPEVRCEILKSEFGRELLERRDRFKNQIRQIETDHEEKIYELSNGSTE